jgi:hypothetical protein
MIRTPVAVAALAALAASPVAPQDTGDPPTARHGAMASDEGMPEGWLMRFDRAGTGADMVDFQVMEPGWHVTTGRRGSGVYWQPGMTARGEFTVRTKLHLFSPASHAEAFGLFVGGESLGGEDQRYLYFVVRQTGEYLIRRRVGGDTEDIVGWTAHGAVPEAAAGEEGPTEYVLSVDVGADEVRFGVDGTTVHTLPRAELRTDGTVGLRINHMLDIHVEELAIE